MQEVPVRRIINSLNPNPPLIRTIPESSDETSNPEEGNNISSNWKWAGAIAGGVTGAVLLVAGAVALWYVKRGMRSSAKRQSPPVKTTVRFFLDAG
jgi:hypothetical protein